MATRSRLYYPDSQIDTNRFSSGNQYMYLDDWSEFMGYYHLYKSTAEVYSEAVWHPTKSRKLIKLIKKSDSYFKYIDLKYYANVGGQKTEIFGPVKLNRYRAPAAIIPAPSEIDTDSGMMTRFLLIKRNEKSTVMPVEINNEQAKTYSIDNYGINQYLYELVEIPWKISGPEFDVVANNIIINPGVYNTNKRIVEVFSKKLPILNLYLTNYKQFSKYDI